MPPDPLREQLQASLGAAYIIDRELGGGGMSRVFVAEETRFHRQVVIKVLSPDLAAGLSVERFEREIGLAAGLQQANIVPVISAGDVDGLPWYSMPYVQGETLRARMVRGSVSHADATKILGDVAHALAYAHERGIIHRDIKPENVLLSGGTAVVTDFGIAKAVSESRNVTRGDTLTLVGTSLGTPAYMAPEQAAGDEVSPSADLYAWGVMAYELLAGRHPFAGKPTTQQLIAAHIAERPAPLREVAPAVAAPLAHLVMQALEKDPAARPASASALIVALAQVATPAAGRFPARASLTSRGRVLAAGAIAMLVVAGAAVVLMRSRPTAGAKSASPAERGIGSISTVAVLPFANTGGDPKTEYFSDGMTDELAHALSQLPGMRVAGRTSSYAFKGKNVPAQEIGKTLGVAGLLEGSVRRDGNRVRLTAQLTGTADGTVLWSDSYERPAGDAFAVQDDITRAIIAALTPALSGAPPAQATGASRGTDNAEAYDLYLRGRYFWAMRGGENLVRAAGYFRRAVEKDPRFARAFAGLAMTYGVLPFYITDPADTLAPLGIAMANRAIGLDPNLADAQLALANALSTNNRPVEALPHENRAIELEPQNATAHQWHGDNLLVLGRVDEAVSELERAVTLDPLSAVIQNDLGQALLGAHRYTDAIVHARRARELFESTVRPTGALAYLFAGHPDSAEAWLAVRTAGDSRSPGMAATLALVYAAEGRWSDVERIRDELTKPGGDRSGGVEAGVVALALGDHAPLVRTLLTPAGQRQWLTRFYSLGCSPVAGPLLSDPAYRAMLDRQQLRACALTTPWPIKARTVRSQ